VIRSALLAPVLLDGEALGVLSVFHQQADYFNDDHLDFLKAAADQMALALRNKQVYEAEGRLADELAKAKEVADAAYRAKSMFLATVSHELRHPDHHRGTAYAAKYAQAPTWICSKTRCRKSERWQPAP
jgi:signal transduction histidine kinase